MPTQIVNLSDTVKTFQEKVNLIIGAVNEVDSDLGTISAVAMGTTASTVGGAIAELEAEIDLLDSNSGLTIGSLSNLTTTAKNNLVAAVNEINAKVDADTTYTAGTNLNLSGTIFHLDSDLVGINSLQLNTMTTTSRVLTTDASGNVSQSQVTSNMIADNAINSEHYTDGSIDRVHLAADVIDGTKIADDAINSEHYAAGSIDNEHIADDAINSEHYAGESIDNEHIANNAVDRHKLKDLESLIIYNSAGTAIKTLYGAGS